MTMDYGINLLLSSHIGFVVFMLSAGMYVNLLYGTEAEKDKINITHVAPYTVEFTVTGYFSSIGCVSLRTNRLPAEY